MGDKKKSGKEVKTPEKEENEEESREAMKRQKFTNKPTDLSAKKNPKKRILQDKLVSPVVENKKRKTRSGKKPLLDLSDHDGIDFLGDEEGDFEEGEIVSQVEVNGENSSNNAVISELSDEDEILFGNSSKEKNKPRKNLVDAYAETPVSDTNFVEKKDLNEFLEKFDQRMEDKMMKLCRQENEVLMNSVLKAVSDVKDLVKGVKEREEILTPEASVANKTVEELPSGRLMEHSEIDGNVVHRFNELNLSRQSPSYSTVFTRVVETITEPDQRKSQNVSDSDKSVELSEGEAGNLTVNDEELNFVETKRSRKEPATSHQIDRELLEKKVDEGLKAAREKMAKTVCEAESQKADMIRLPPGERVNLISNREQDKLNTAHMLEDDSDDKEFQIGYYLDDIVITKIKAGRYVDFSKLLPKDKVTSPNDDEQNGLQLMPSNGFSYVVHKEKEHQEVNSYSRWRTAFDVYAGLYLKANPLKAAEIHQYASEIESAAQTYIWENVYGYDKMFRHRIDRKTNKSWARTYQKAWNKFMRDRKGSWNKSNAVWSGNSKKQALVASVKKKLCWIFNKRAKCKFGKNCRFDHKCSTCGSTKHGALNCDQKKGGKVSNESN